MKLFSRSMFDLSKEQRIILSLIAKNGPSTEYRLGELGSNRNLNRYSIQRKLRGREITHNSLLENNYVVLVQTSKFKNTGRKRRLFGLSLKGLMASLGEIKFNNTYLVKNYFEYLQNDYTDYNLSFLSLQLVKYNMLLMMSWHHSKGLLLSNLHDTKRYVLDWTLSNNLMKANFGHSSIMSEDAYLIPIREKFFALLSIVSALIKKLEGSYVVDLSEINLDDKNAVNKRLWRNIQHWPLLMESIQTKNNHTYSNPSEHIAVFPNVKNIAKYQSTILAKLKIGKISLDENLQFPSEFII